MKPIPIERWDGCYDVGWQGLIHPEAFAHPAKMARGLLMRIFDELVVEGALHPRDTVVDPFGGIGTTGLIGSGRFIRVICCELEPKFVDLARKNFAALQPAIDAFGHPRPVIVQGDSRQLRQHVWPIVRASAVVCSPPYVSGGHHTDVMGAWNANGGGHGVKEEDAGYGKSEGQLAQLHEGSIDAVVSSPPYAEIASGAGGLNTKPATDGQQGGRSATSPSQATDQRYGETDGQLARLHLDDVEVVISSPPYSAEGLGHCKAHHASNDTGRSDVVPTAAEKFSKADLAGRDYGSAEGQLSNMASGDVDAVVSSPPFTQGYCLTPNQRVLTSDLRWVEVGQIKTGDRLLAFDEHLHRRHARGRKFAITDVVRSERGIKDCVRVFLENGDQIECSADHPWLSDRYRDNGGGGQRAWVEAKELSGRFAVRSLPTWVSDTTRDGGWLAGIFDGEGTLCMRRESTPGHQSFILGFAQNPGLVLDEARRLLAASNFTFSAPDRPKAKATNLQITGGVAEALRLIGTLRPVRLLRKFESLPITDLTVRSDRPGVRVKVVAVVPIGYQQVQSIETSTGTYIGEGYLMHNSSGGGINKKGYGKDGADKVGSRTYQGTGAEREDGNLETLDLGDIDAVVSSPPREANAEGHVKATKFKSPADFLTAGRGHGCSDEARLAQMERDQQKTYGTSDGQLGNEGGETFWSAARGVVAEAYAILKPGGVAAWVVKAFVRDKQIVDFPGDWRKLCEHVGFETIKEVHASLVAEDSAPNLFGGEIVTRRERKSFFRRLAEKKGSPRIDFEVVYFMRKPLV